MLTMCSIKEKWLAACMHVSATTMIPHMERAAGVS